MDIPMHDRHKNVVGHFSVDDVDGDLAQFVWSHRKKPHLRPGASGYAGRNYRHGGRGAWLENIYPHRIVLERKIGRALVKGELPDHVDGNGLNNRRDNLRVASALTNAQNRRDLPEWTTSGFRGVHSYQTKRRGVRYGFNVWCRGVRYYQGKFTSAAAAGEAALRKRVELGFLGAEEKLRKMVEN